MASVDVGDLVNLPEGHQKAGARVGIPVRPGRVVSIEDGWAMVDMSPYGEFGVAVDQLTPVEPPSWLAEAVPNGSDWRVIGERRCRGRWADRWRQGVCYLAWDEQGHWAPYVVPDEAVHDALDRRSVEEFAFRRIGHALAAAALPACVVPNCKDKGRVRFVAAEKGRLAGRDWQAGDPIDLCASHGEDVYRAQFVRGVDQLAEWLQPDARLDTLDELDAESPVLRHEIIETCSRMLRTRPVDPAVYPAWPGAVR